MKKLLIAIFVIAVVLSALTLCACEKPIAFTNLTVLTDINQGETPFTIGIPDSDATVELSSDGTTLWENVPVGTYTVTVTRYGVAENRSVTVTENGTLDLTLFGGYETSATEKFYRIQTAEQLLNLNKLSDTTETVNYKLAANIDLSTCENATIDAFTGVLDGKYGSTYYTLSGYSATSDEDTLGLFHVNKGTLVNLKLTNSTVSGKNNVGVLVGDNEGTIDNCQVTASTVTGATYVGGVCGLDNGFMANCLATVTVNAQSYYGQVVGVSFGNIRRGTFSELPGYGIRPSETANLAINEDDAALIMLLKSLNNWSELEHRTKLAKFNVTADASEIVNDIGKAYLDGADSNLAKATSQKDYMWLAMNILRNITASASANANLRMVYDGKESEGLDELFLYADAYVSKTSLDRLLSFLNGLMDEPLEVTDVPESVAFYYNDGEDYLQGAIGEDTTFVDPDADTKIIMSDYENAKVSWGNISDDMQRYIDSNLDSMFTQDFWDFMQDYIVILKNYLLTGEIANWAAENIPSISEQTKSHANGLYNISFTVDAAELYGDMVEIVKERLRTDLVGTLLEGIDVSFTFEPVTVSAEIWDNGFIKKLAVSGLDITINAVLPQAAQEWLSDLFIDNFDLSSFSITELTARVYTEAPIYELYSYSETDTDLELQTRVFNEDNKVNFVDDTLAWLRRRAAEKAAEEQEQ